MSPCHSHNGSCSDIAEESTFPLRNPQVRRRKVGKQENKDSIMKDILDNPVLESLAPYPEENDISDTTLTVIFVIFVVVGCALLLAQVVTD